MQLTQYLDRWHASHRYGVARSTLAQYRYAITSFERHLGRTASLSDLTDSLVSAWVDWLRENRSPHTARTQRGSLLTLWRSAWRDDLVAQPPKRVRDLRMPPPAPRAWSAADVARLIAAAEQLPGCVRGSPIRRGPHLVAFLRVAWDTGFRLGDVLRLQPDDILQRGVVDVAQHKTGVRQVVRMWMETTAAVRETMDDDPNRVLIFPFAARRYQDWVKSLSKQLGMPGSIKWIRRGVGTAAEVEGGYGTRMLGHTDGRTLRYYLDRSQLEPVVAPRLPSTKTPQRMLR